MRRLLVSEHELATCVILESDNARVVCVVLVHMLGGCVVLVNRNCFELVAHISGLQECLCCIEQSFMLHVVPAVHLASLPIAVE